MEKPTNGLNFEKLSAKEKEKFRETYRNSPLSKYINWEKFYKSDNGNTLDFVVCLEKKTDDEGNVIFVLENIQENGEDYLLVYNCTDGCFYKEPEEF